MQRSAAMLHVRYDFDGSPVLVAAATALLRRGVAGRANRFEAVQRADEPVVGTTAQVRVRPLLACSNQRLQRVALRLLHKRPRPRRSPRSVVGR
jgi:hypothetical protein